MNAGLGWGTESAVPFWRHCYEKEIVPLVTQGDGGSDTRLVCSGEGEVEGRDSGRGRALF